MTISRPRHDALLAIRYSGTRSVSYDGKAWGRIVSLIETCKINGVEPFAYLKATLEAIAAGHPQSRIDDLLPWNFQPSS